MKSKKHKPEQIIRKLRAKRLKELEEENKRLKKLEILSESTSDHISVSTIARAK